MVELRPPIRMVQYRTTPPRTLPQATMVSLLSNKATPPSQHSVPLTKQPSRTMTTVLSTTTTVTSNPPIPPLPPVLPPLRMGHRRVLYPPLSPMELSLPAPPSLRPAPRQTPTILSLFSSRAPMPLQEATMDSTIPLPPRSTTLNRLTWCLPHQVVLEPPSTPSSPTPLPLAAASMERYAPPKPAPLRDPFQT